MGGVNDSYEIRLQDRAMELLKADTDLAGESPDIRPYYDQSRARNKLGVVVQCFGLRNRNVGKAGGGSAYEASLSIATHSIVSRDADGRIFEKVSHRVRQIVESWSQTPHSMSVASNGTDALTMEGVLQSDPQEIFEADFVGRIQTVRLFFRRA